MTKSRTDFLRTIKQAGVSIRVITHWQTHLVGTVRTPKIVRNSGKPGIQTNGYYFDGISHAGKPCEMWAAIPPASDLRFNADGSVTFYPEQEKSWTLEVIVQ